MVLINTAIGAFEAPLQGEHDMSEFELLVKLHSRNSRQGPGGKEQTKRAMELAGLKQDELLKVADIGCGTGASALVLAKDLNATVNAIDLFSDFLKVLERECLSRGLEKVDTITASMESLPFNENELDVIWSEGAIYNIGFKKGVESWRPFLKKGGILAVSEITWLTDERPDEINKYWQTHYPEIGTPSQKIRVLESAGYKILGYFPLPESCWEENYYQPLETRFCSFLHEQEHAAEAIKIVDAEKNEIELYRRFKNYYSYGFYVAEKL